MNGRAGAMVIITIVLAGMRLAVSPGRSSLPNAAKRKSHLWKRIPPNRKVATLLTNHLLRTIRAAEIRSMR